MTEKVKKVQTKIRLNRRQFLKTVTGTTLAAVSFPYIVPSSALGKAGSIAPSNRIAMGAIGVGNQGERDMRGFLGKEQVQMLAVCDVDASYRARAKKKVDEKYGNNDCKTYRDFRELIARGDLDAVMLALPDHWHAIPAIAAAQAGLDIHAQKPLARTIRQGRAICDAVRHNDIVWQTGSQQRSNARFRRACELVRNGRIGKIHKVEVGLPIHDNSATPPVSPLPVPEGLDWELWLGPAPSRPYQLFDVKEPNLYCHRNWRWIMDYSGGALTDMGAHHIDIAHWGLGLEYTGPVEIQGRGEYPKVGLWDVPITYKFTCKYANGMDMIVTNYDQLPNHEGTAWYGQNGWIHVNRYQLKAEPNSILDEPIGPNEIRLYESHDHKQNFLDCVKSRRPTIAPAEVGHRSISIALLGEIAMLTGRKLEWDPRNERFVNDPEANRLLSRPMRSPWHL